MKETSDGYSVQGKLSVVCARPAGVGDDDGGWVDRGDILEIISYKEEIWYPD